MSFKDVLKDTIKLGGCLGFLVVSGGIVGTIAYRRGFLDAYSQTKITLEDITKEAKQKTAEVKAE